MKFVLGCAILLCAMTELALAAPQAKLYKRFSDWVNTPDGMTADADGNLILAAPNRQNDDYPGCILRQNRRTGKWELLTPGLLNPDTGRAAPAGIAYAPDGNIYYCDNQYGFNKSYKSRILRVIMDKNGNAVSIEPVVENIKAANGLRVYDNALFFTDTLFGLKDRNTGGVYRVPFSAFRERPARLLPKEQADRDPYFLGEVKTANGLCHSSNGDLYVSDFSEGRLYKLIRTADGYQKPTLIFSDPKRCRCLDGIVYDAKRNCIFMTDSRDNAIRVWDIAHEYDGTAFSTLWENSDSDGADGLLDQPSEPFVFGDELLVSNYDSRCAGFKNSHNDKVHTISIINLD